VSKEIRIGRPLSCRATFIASILISNDTPLVFDDYYTKLHIVATFLLVKHSMLTVFSASIRLIDGVYHIYLFGGTSILVYRHLVMPSQRSADMEASVQYDNR